VCEEKHMGSRAVVLLTRDDDVAEERFGLAVVVRSIRARAARSTLT